MIPKFEKDGNLSKGIHRGTPDEIRKIFGTGSARRKW
jgi:hypothetical protein